MVVIRLSRGGAKKRPFYKIVAADRRAPRDGAYLEHLGYFNPIAIGGEKRIEIDQERLTHWLNNGAQPSDRVRSILRELDNPELVDKRKAKKAARKLKQKEKAKVEVEVKAQEEAKPEEPASKESVPAPEPKEEPTPEAKEESAAPEPKEEPTPEAKEESAEESK